VRTVCQFFEAERDGNAIHLFAPGGGSPLHSFTFPRQPKPDGLCLSDYVLDPHEGARDHIALFVVTAGEGVRRHSAQAKESGEFLLAHALQAIAVETAEAAAEWLHRTLREDWGFPDPPDLTMQQRFTAHYHGKRYSPGFPACPNLDDQQGIWKLLRPEEIGVSLTENMMMTRKPASAPWSFIIPTVRSSQLRTTARNAFVLWSAPGTGHRLDSRKIRLFLA